MECTSLDNWIKRKHKLDPSDRNAIEQYQLDKICQLCDYVRSHSKFYARLFKQLENPQSLKDFSYFPTTKAKDLVENTHEFLCVDQSDIARIVTLQTSGTSQEAKRVYFTREDIKLTLDFFMNGMKTLCGAGDNALILFPFKTPDSVGALLAKSLERLGLTVYCSDRQNAFRIFNKQRIDVVCGPASWLTEVAGQTIGYPVRAVLSSSEIMKKDMRSYLSECWKAEIFDHYGTTEMGLGGAVECQAHQGMHIRENDLYFETVAPDGTPLPDGQEGELLVTTLTRKGMPFIRYRTGDIGLISNQGCSCGSQVRRIIYAHRIEEF